MAKTFFNENDKTPNYDGFFEILSTKHLGKIPKKQFIVQIKGTENLKYIFHTHGLFFLFFLGLEGLDQFPLHVLAI